MKIEVTFYLGTTHHEWFEETAIVEVPNWFDSMNDTWQDEYLLVVCNEDLMENEDIAFVGVLRWTDEVFLMDNTLPFE